MNYQIMDLLMKFLTTILTIITTYFITRYTYNRNRPLQNYELAYDNIYYPIYRLVKNKDRISTKQFIAQIDFILMRNEKYSNLTTLISFERYKTSYNNNLSEYKVNHYYDMFVNDINRYNNFLRYRLGYLSPNYLNLFKYLSCPEKVFVILFFDLLILYFGSGIYSFIILYFNKQILFLAILIVFSAFFGILCTAILLINKILSFGCRAMVKIRGYLKR